VKIYTRTGDRGETGLIGGYRVSKTDPRIAAVGDVDELNAALGIARLDASGSELDQELQSIQEFLFELGAELASVEGGRRAFTSAAQLNTERLERSIDRQTEALEPLQNFILPGGSGLAARLHLARSVCRRAERAILSLEPREDIVAYINRLSDWLFVAARTANTAAGVKDVAWRAPEASG
jgi:cob(I)alamin adenosyltransferase